MVGEPAMGLWNLNLERENKSSILLLNILYTQTEKEEKSWANNELYLGLLALCGQRPRLRFILMYFQLLNSSWVYNMLMTTATFKTLITQALNPNIFVAQLRSMLCREETNKTFALHSDFRISI